MYPKGEPTDMALAALATRRPLPGAIAATDPLRRRMPIRALVVHQAEVVRAGVSTLLATAALCETTHVASAFEAFRIAGATRPDIILYDFRQGEGPEATRLLASLWPRPRLVALVAAGSQIAPERCLRAGADAAIAIENVSGGQFLAAVEHAIEGRGPAIAGFPRTGPHPIEADEDESPTAMLTPREREMLFLIGEGLSNREIAESLVLSVKTVETHRANLSRKLNVRSRAGLMRLAMGIRLGDTSSSR
jgi:DNA-binding NarL/FixJ family response regulator